MIPSAASWTRSLPTKSTFELVAGRWPVSGPCWSTESDSTAPSAVRSCGVGGCAAAAAPCPTRFARPRASTVRPTASRSRFMRATSSAVGSGYSRPSWHRADDGRGLCSGMTRVTGPRRDVCVLLGLRVEAGQVLASGSGLGDEQAVEAAIEAVAVDEAVVAVGGPQAFGVGRFERGEVVVGDFGGGGRIGEVDHGDPAAVPRGDEPVALVGLQHVEQVRGAVLLLGLHARDLEGAELGAVGRAVEPDLALRSAAVAL